MSTVISSSSSTCMTQRSRMGRHVGWFFTARSASTLWDSVLTGAHKRPQAPLNSQPMGAAEAPELAMQPPPLEVMRAHPAVHFNQG